MSTPNRSSGAPPILESGQRFQAAFAEIGSRTIETEGLANRHAPCRDDRASDGERSVIDVRAVHKTYDGGAGGAVSALRGVSVAIRNNEFFTLLGPSGCGKTTLLRLLAGFEQPTAGEILLAGQPVHELPPHRRPINTVFQHYALFPNMSVAENVGFGLKMLGHDKSAIDKRVAEMLALVKMEQFANRRTTQLSGGQQQRIALARGLAPRPKVLLLDEPLSALDLKLRQAMRLELKTLQAETGITFVFVTHDQEEALAMSDRVAVLSDGVIQQIGRPQEIYDHPANQFVAQFIGENNVIAGQVMSKSAGSLQVQLPGIGILNCSDSHALSSGDRITVAIRPEKLCFSVGDASPDVLRFSGLVAASVYLGTDMAYHIQLSSGQRVMVRDLKLGLKGKLPQVGEQISLDVAYGDVNVLKD